MGRQDAIGDVQVAVLVDRADASPIRREAVLRHDWMYPNRLDMIWLSDRLDGPWR
jgi:hypothetical protein